jgi:hypothetical protein
MSVTVINGNGLLPMPPVETVFNAPFANVTTALFAVIGLGLLVRGLLRPGERTIICAMFVAGAVTCLIEPFLDIASGAWHPQIGQRVAFSLVGRDIPWWVLISYTVYYGGLGSLNLLAFLKGVSRRAVFLWFLVPILFDIGEEQFMLHWKLYYYYGNQPLLLGKFPLYQAFANSAGEIMGVTTLYFLSRVISGWKWFPAAAVVMPVCGAMGFVGAGLPSFYAVNMDLPNWLTQACGLLTCVIALGVVMVAANLVGTDSPLRRAGLAGGWPAFLPESGLRTVKTPQG